MNVREQGQWLRLRELRVQRAREQLAAADAACAAAQQAVLARQQAIEQCRAELRAHAESGVGAWAAHLPRWGNVFSVHRDRLAERLERAEYALIDDERALEQAQEVRQQKRADLSRAQAREGAVQTLVKAMGAERIHLREVRVELDNDERACVRAGGQA
jgi:dTDP-4-amino-4,6-dideoxygalactose transaminase